MLQQQQIALKKRKKNEKKISQNQQKLFNKTSRKPQDQDCGASSFLYLKLKFIFKVIYFVLLELLKL